LAHSLREDAAQSIERLLAEKIRELETFKTEAVKRAEQIVADKIQQIEENLDSFEHQRFCRFDETGLWQTQLPPPIPSSYPVPPPLPTPPPLPSPHSPPPLPTQPPLPFPPRTPAKIDVTMPSLEGEATIDRNQIKIRTNSSRKSRQYKTERNKSGFFLLLAFEFALGFGLCYWWWSHWFAHQPFIPLNPNKRGVVVSVDSLRRFYNGIRLNENFTNVEREWKSYEPNFRKAGSTIEMDADADSIVIGVDDWRIGATVSNGKIVTKSLSLVVDSTAHGENKVMPPIFPQATATVPPPPTPPAVEPSTDSGSPLSKIRPKTAQVGSGKAFAATLYSFQNTYANSLNAHAPSHYVFHLNREWKTLKTHYGLRNLSNLNEANCVFIIKGNDLELFRSVDIRDNQEYFLELNVSDIDKLELITMPNGNGNSDRGAWLTPTLSR
jgi:hypothetical protein